MHVAAIAGLLLTALYSVPGPPAAGIAPYLQENQTPSEPAPSSGAQAPDANPPGASSQPAPQEENKPDQEAPAQGTTPAVPAAPAAAEPKTPGEKPAGKTATTRKKSRHRKTKAAGGSPGAGPGKKVVRNGGTGCPIVQLAPGVSAEQASNQRQNTSQLLASTDVNLKEISGRALSPSQQDSVTQIRKYVEQAQAADQAGDTQRANNLAAKALLLSQEMVKK